MGPALWSTWAIDALSSRHLETRSGPTDHGVNAWLLLSVHTVSYIETFLVTRRGNFSILSII